MTDEEAARTCVGPTNIMQCDKNIEVGCAIYSVYARKT